MTPPPPGTLVRTTAELAAAWQGLMGAGGFGTASIWIVFLDADDRLLPVVVPIDGIAGEPDDLFVGNLAMIIRNLVEDGTAASAALLLSRPGPRAMTDSDRQWARALRTALGELAVWPIHLATYEHIQPFAPDDFIPMRRGA